MDIKRRRREAGPERGQIWDNYPGTPPGSFAQGSAAADQNSFWWARSQSWSEGAGTNYLAIQQEGEQEHERWGTPWRDTCPAPNEPGENPVGIASRNADDPLPSPANYFSNPGYLGTSTASSLVQSAPGGMYRTAGPRGTTSSQAHRPMPVGGRQRERAPGRTVLPAGGARQTESEGNPLVVSTGAPGR